MEDSNKPNELPEEQAKQLHDILEKIRDECVHKGYVPRLLFKDYDSHSKGCVSKTQFLQSLPFKFLTDLEKKILILRYAISPNDVNYLWFHEDVEGKTVPKFFNLREAKHEIKQHREKLTAMAQDPSHVNVEELENNIMTLMAKHRIRMDDSFRDFDPLRSGFVTETQFKAALNIVKLPRAKFTPAELAALTAKYSQLQQDGKTLVCYKAMLDNYAVVFTESNLEKQPLKEILATKTLKSVPNKKTLNEMEEKYEAVLTTIKNIVRTRRIQLKPLFQDFDQSLSGLYATRRVTRNRFERALSMIGIKLAPEEYAILAEKYNDLNDGTVNYLLFLQDIDAMHDMDMKFEVPNKKFIKERVVTDLTLDDVMKKIQYKVLADRIRLAECMKDFDPLRSGSISKNQFLSCFSVAGINLTAEEMNILNQRFRNTNKPDLILWR